MVEEVTLWTAGRTIRHARIMVKKIAVSLDQKTVDGLDRWVKVGRYSNRSRALQTAMDVLIEREKRSRLARELSKLDPAEEKKLAEESFRDAAWPKY